MQKTLNVLRNIIGTAGLVFAGYVFLESIPAIAMACAKGASLLGMRDKWVGKVRSKERCSGASLTYTVPGMVYYPLSWRFFSEPHHGT